MTTHVRDSGGIEEGSAGPTTPENARGDKTFNLDLGHGEFTARSMKRLDKARLHVRDEIQGLALGGSVLEELGVLALYEEERL